MNYYESFEYGDLKPYETNYNDVYKIIEKFIENTQDGLSQIAQVSLLLNNDKLNAYITDFLNDYTFKQIFHDAVEFFNKDKDYKDNYTKFAIDYKEFFINTYNTYIDNLEFNNYLENLHLMLNARKKSRLSTSFKNKISEFSVKNNVDYCYLCGSKTKYKQKVDKFNLDYLYNSVSNENNSFQGVLNNCEKELNILPILDKYDISERDKVNITKDIYSNVNFNTLRKKYHELYNKLNSDTLEIEHLHPVGWGGSKTVNNLLSSCHKCNQDKKDLAFYTDYSINRFFVNYQNDLEIIKKRINGNLGKEALISLKMKHKYKCYNNECQNHFYDSNIEFYLMKEEDSKGYHFFNLRIMCQPCLKDTLSEDKQSSEYLEETYIKLITRN